MTMLRQAAVLRLLLFGFVVQLAPAVATAADGPALRPLASVPPPIWIGLQDGAPAIDPARPPEVLSWRHRILGRSDYADLARQWEAFAGDHPRDAAALVEWGDALRYAGHHEQGVERYARAFAVDSSNAAAAAAYWLHQAHSAPDEIWRLAHESLIDAANGDPWEPATYYPLWMTALRAGDGAIAAECLRRMVALGDLPRPLLDWGRNMIAGAPHSAIVFTNGDNDTYPPLAWQAITGERRDLLIVNLSLLNTHWYVRHCRDQGAPIPLSDEQIAALVPRGERRVSHQVQDQMLAAAGDRVICYAVTVSAENMGGPRPLRIEGLLRRVLPESTADSPRHDWDRTRELLDTIYLLESARDPCLDWARESALVPLFSNYSALLAQLAEHLLETGRPGEAGPYYLRAVQLLAFHGGRSRSEELIAAWEERDRQNPLIGRARALLGR